MEYTQRSIFNYHTAPHNNTETSADAAESIKPIINNLCSKVLSLISNSEFGLTCDEAEQSLHLSHQTCSARFNDLSTCQPPLIIKAINPDGTPVKRRTRSGRKAFVWIASTFSAQTYAELSS